jgi:hypothetical protein
MEIKHIWSVLCGQSIINSENNEISLISIIEHLNVNVALKDDKEFKKGIKVPISYEIVSMWVKADDNKEVKGFIEIDVTLPNGQVKKIFNNELIIPIKTKRMRTRIKINGLIVHEDGIYNFIVKYRDVDQKNNEVVATLPMEITIKKVLQTPVKN